MIATKTLPHPKSKSGTDMTAEQLRSVFQDNNPLFQLSSTPVQNPPLQTIRCSKSPATVYFDVGSCFISNEAPFAQFNRFVNVKMLTLRNCGLLTLPVDLQTLPPKCQYLDLSQNYLTTLPAAVQWDRLIGLNLSENAFLDWPLNVIPDKLPRLAFLYLSGNSIASSHDFGTGFRSLRCFDISHTKIVEIPKWLFRCEQLKILKIGGSWPIRGVNSAFLTAFPGLRFADLTGAEFDANAGWFEKGDALELFVMRGLPHVLAPCGKVSTVV
jgi:hypothetical protein